MNRSKIEYVDHTYNPITGCRHGCGYCYAAKMVKRFAGDIRLNKMAKADYWITGEGLYELDKPMLNETGKPLVYPFGFEPTLHRYRIGSALDRLKMGNNIFVGAMADCWGDWVPDAWLDEVLASCIERPMHNYLFLTKNPVRYWEYGGHRHLPVYDNMWYGTTVTDNYHAVIFTKMLPDGAKKWVSIEPILEGLSEENIRYMCDRVDWIVIGAETGRRKDRVVPEPDWIREIVLEADNHGIPVFMKDSLEEIVGGKNMRRDYPPELMSKRISQKMTDKLYGKCNRCKNFAKKSEMVTIMGRRKRGEPARQFAFLCHACLKKTCYEWGAEYPYKGDEE